MNIKAYHRHLLDQCCYCGKGLSYERVQTVVVLPIYTGDNNVDVHEFHSRLEAIAFMQHEEIREHLFEDA